MITLLACAAIFVAFVASAIVWSPVPWQDDGDVRGIVQHTVRVPSVNERLTLWNSRYWLYLEHGDKLAPRLPMDPKPMLTVVP